MLERVTRANTLYDFYSYLLSTKQKQLFELYYHEDWSLAEIAEKYNMSRQGVSDNIRRCENSLEDYEKKLQLSQKHYELNQKLNEITMITKKINMTDYDKYTILKVVEDIRRTN